MNREEQPDIGNCPHCTKIIFKNAVFNSEAAFSMRCPHCNKTVRVIIKHKIEIVILPVQEGLNQKKGPSHGMIAIILTLYLPPMIYHLMHHADNIIDILT